MASRSLDDLRPETQVRVARMISTAADLGLTVLVYCTLRPFHEQARLYRQGRALARIEAKARELAERWGRPDLADVLMGVGPQRGPKRTNAAPGESLHNYGLAADAVPLVDGKPVWDAVRPENRGIWMRFGRAAQEAGLVWAGTWRHFREFPHVQEPDVDWRELITVVPAGGV